MTARFIILRVFVIQIFCFSAFAQSNIVVTLSADPKVRDLPDTSLQDQIAEQSKRELLLQKQRKLDDSAQKYATQKAALYYQKGRELFTAGDFERSRKYFEKAISLDASVDQYYHEWAIALFKTGSHRRSLAVLANLEDSEVNQSEVRYYSGLNLFKMNQLNDAINEFKAVQEDEDPILSPLAAMYAGITFSQLQKYSEAKQAFQTVLDTSKDASLDNKAESYIEGIERYESFLREASRKWSYSLFAGTSYDENVLNVAANNISTGVEAYRLIYGASLAYKAYFSQNKSWIPTFAVSDIYSFNKDFESDATIQGTDPLQWDFSAPFKYFFSAGKHNLTLTLTPGYQQLFMSLGESSRNLIFSSAFLRTQLSTSHLDSLYTDYQLSFSNDQSELTVTNAADNQSAQKITLGLTNTYLLNKKGSQTIFNDLYYVMNSAEGDNNTYNKSLINLGYSHPTSESWVLYTKMEYFHQDFMDSSTARVDDNISITLGANYAISEKSNLALSLMYMDNESSVSFFSYDKVAVTAIWSFNSSFF